MAHKSQKIDQIQAVTHAHRILQLAQKGVQPRAIAREVGLSPDSVNQILNTILAEQTLELHEYAGRLLTLSLMRLEYIYSKVAPFALPHKVRRPPPRSDSNDVDELPDNVEYKPKKRRKSQNQADNFLEDDYIAGPDPKLLPILLNTIKLQKEIAHDIQKAGIMDDEGGAINIEHLEGTITATNPLYLTANANMQDTWLNEYADMELDELYTAPAESLLPLDKKIADLEAAMPPESENEDA